ncbi:unnamed protein product [Rotaria magnacalcarata]|uniref:Uncharacterized protein n=1 Tax=Rotaria magnacalcarata TaxID=392030 RepID=A0A820B9Y3_9BILA|nr:unnamed protein product [Rotaria magnacalcarata]CAF3844265.1 unnamed protein product [Rotaria magnacalcarata]CAF3855654.1 unnamed protein product [Rotaria magnacalcarata]CAF4198890.1 unnamed protein product [Rotaria magnacalcarata]CAF4203991.1 unnamed protein product [Rotaria magnacalcarata]
MEIDPDRNDGVSTQTSQISEAFTDSSSTQRYFTNIGNVTNEIRTGFRHLLVYLFLFPCILLLVGGTIAAIVLALVYRSSAATTIITTVTTTTSTTTTTTTITTKESEVLISLNFD